MAPDRPSEQRRLERMEDLVSLCARRGFIFPSSEIYGGINGFWDYGPLGVEFKSNLKEVWWQRVVRAREPGRRRATSSTSATRWWTVGPARSGFARISSTRPVPVRRGRGARSTTTPNLETST
jgi:hypothetical protein